MKNLILLILSIFIYSTINAQGWTDDTELNTLVVESESGDIRAIGTSDGQTYVVFWKSVASPENYELRVQLIDADGLRQFGDDGILFGNNLPMSTWTAIMSVTIDDLDNLYVGVTGTSSMAAYAYKIDKTGNLLWGDEGILLGSGFMVNILPLETEEAIIVWNSDDVILMQKYSAEGSAVWGENQTVTLPSGNTSPGNLFELSNGDYVMIMHAYNFGISSLVYAQRYNADGEQQWASATQLADVYTVFNTEYTGAQDGDVIYFGYMGSHSNRFDSYLQRLNPDGTLPWGINGVDFDVNQTNFEMDTRIAFAEGSEYVWSICKYSNTNQSQFGEWVQKFDKETGTRKFTENAKMVYNISDNTKVHASDLHLINDNPLFILEIGLDNGATPTQLDIVLLDENGGFAWPEESKPLATYSANKQRTHLVRPVNNQAVAVFVEERTDGQKVYAQNFVQESTSLNQPILISPENNATGVDVISTFTWDAVINADSYHIQIAEDDAFTNLLVDDSDIINTAFEASLPDYEIEYFWKVKASNDDGDSNWSEIWSFTTEDNVGFQELISNKIKIHPNPIQDYLTIDLNVNATATVTSLDGKILNVFNHLDLKSPISLIDLLPGAYLISIYDENDKLLVSEKIIKK